MEYVLKTKDLKKTYGNYNACLLYTSDAADELVIV